MAIVAASAARRLGFLRSHGVFPESGRISRPSSMSMIEASTLPCAALTARNAFFGLEGRKLQAGQYVLTQGTGGVIMFAIQIALAAGVKAIATTSSEEKVVKLRMMGVQHALNYKTQSDWGEVAKRLTTDGLGVHHVLEVDVNSTVSQSFSAFQIEGVFSIVGKHRKVQPSLPGHIHSRMPGKRRQRGVKRAIWQHKSIHGGAQG